MLRTPTSRAYHVGMEKTGGRYFMISSFLVFIVGLRFRDYSLSQVSASVGQDQRTPLNLVVEAFHCWICLQPTFTH